MLNVAELAIVSAIMKDSESYYPAKELNIQRHMEQDFATWFVPVFAASMTRVFKENILLNNLDEVRQVMEVMTGDVAWTVTDSSSLYQALLIHNLNEKGPPGRYFARAWLSSAPKAAAYSIGGRVISATAGVIASRIAKMRLERLFSNPESIKSLTPTQVEAMTKAATGWRVEVLRQGSKEGQGWVIREYTDDGIETTGRMLRWHPGGGHHGPDPRWRVISHNTNTLVPFEHK